MAQTLSCAEQCSSEALPETDGGILEQIYGRHADSVYRVCLMYTRNTADAEDVTQNTFLKLLRKRVAFKDIHHEKAWLLKAASNECKTLLSIRKRYSGDEPPSLHTSNPEIDETLEKVLALPEKYKLALYLHYYEGYRAVEIAKMTGKPDSTIRSYLHKGRALLRIQLDEKGE